MSIKKISNLDEIIAYEKYKDGQVNSSSHLDRLLKIQVGKVILHNVDYINTGTRGYTVSIRK